MPLFTLLTVPFAFTLGAFVFTGLLGPMSEALGVSLATAGTLQAAFAISCALAGPILATLTRKAERKPLLLITLALLVMLNAASAMPPDFRSLLVLRILVGGAGSLALPLAVAIAAALSTPEKRAGSIATVYSGVSVAFMTGIPLGSLIGTALGWQSSFALASVFSLASFLLVWRNVPDVPPMPVPASGDRLGGRVLAYLLITLMAFMSMFAMVGFIGPVITATTGFGGAGIAAIQVLIGLSGIVGLRIGARVAISGTRIGLPLIFLCIAAALGILAHPLSAGTAAGYGLAMMLLSAAVAPGAQFSTAPIVQTRLAEVAGPAATLAFALNGSMVYLGQGLGVSIGAVALRNGGLWATAATGACLALVGAVLALWIATSVRRPTVAAE